MFEQEYRDYCNICLKACTDESIFKTFKQDTTYRTILEHTSVEQGSEYINCIQNLYPINELPWQIIKQNDIIGSPITHDYSNQYIGNISPSTLRYVYYGLEFLLFLQKNNFTTPNIIEIGGGYGGQCYITYILSSLFNIKIQNYLILDLKEPSKLAAKYTKTLLPENKIIASTINNIEIAKNKKNVLISNYAYSELDKSTREQYIERVITKTSGGYIVWNTVDEFEPFFHLCKLDITEETPKTGPNNKVVTFLSPL